MTRRHIKLKSEISDGELSWEIGPWDNEVSLTLIGDWFEEKSSNKSPETIGLAIDSKGIVFLVEKRNSNCWIFEDVLKQDPYLSDYYIKIGLIDFYKSYIRDQKINNIIE